MVNSNSPTDKTGLDGFKRRSVLRGAGAAAAAGIAGVGLSGTASAHDVIGKPVFCGCETLCVCIDGRGDVLMAQETDDGYHVGFVVGANRLEPYPDGAPRFNGNFCISTADPQIPDGKIIGLQVEDRRWVNPNECAQDALEAEQEQLASTHPRPVGDSGMRCAAPPCEDADPAPDVPILNYALTLEHLENAFYREGLAEFSDEELMEADVLSDYGETVRRQVPEYLQVISDHELAHVEILMDVIESLGGEPLDEAVYDFGYETPTEFLAIAQALENTGVSAYAGAATPIVNNDILSAAASFHSVEARHASFLNLVNGDEPYPDMIDEARTVEEVLDIAGQFVMAGVDPADYELGDDRPEQDRKADDGVTDLDVLNYALTLEHLENAFYRDGLAEFSDDDLMNADVLEPYDDELRMAVPELLEKAGAHEAAHVEVIADTVESLGGEPVEELTYDFGYETPSEFLGVAKALENTGVAAYAGAAPSVSNDGVFDAAIGIHSVEARHAAVMNGLNVTSPFPDVADEALTMDEVVDIISQFIVSDDDGNGDTSDNKGGHLSEGSRRMW